MSKNWRPADKPPCRWSSPRQNRALRHEVPSWARIAAIASVASSVFGIRSGLTSPAAKPESTGVVLRLYHGAVHDPDRDHRLDRCDAEPSDFGSPPARGRDDLAWQSVCPRRSPLLPQDGALPPVP